MPAQRLSSGADTTRSLWSICIQSSAASSSSPTLGGGGGQALGPKGRRILWGGLALIFVLFILALFTHRSIQADWMSHVMNASVYIFFSSMYAAGVLVLMEVLRYIDRRAFGFYTYAPLWKRKLMRQASLVLAAVVFVGTLFVGYHNVRYPVVLHQDLYLKRLTPEGAKAEKRLRLVSSPIYISARL